MDKKYSIQFVSRLTGINAHTIRAWEKRYKAVNPTRNHSGKRVFTQEEVDRLSLLAELVNLGNSISDIANLKLVELNALYEEYKKKQGSLALEKKDNQQGEPVDTNLTLQNLINGIYNYKLDIISYELDKVKKKLGPRDFALNILSPLLQEVGSLVENKMLNVAQEHSLSAILRFHVGHILYKQYGNQNGSQISVALATPEDELHEFGILIGALLCAYYNIKFYYFGPNLPAKSLTEAACQTKVNIVILGVTQGYAANKNEKLGDYLANIAESLDGDQQVWVGGINRLSSFADQEKLVILPTINKLDQKLASLIK